MPWYKTGTVKTTINSNAIIGTGTAFISNSRVGDAFRGPDGNWYEVVNIASDTAMSISPNYRGPTVAAGTYSIAPMQGYVKESADALRAASLVIGNAATDMSDQVNAAKASAADALASKNEASASAESASTSAATATTKATEAASSASTATTQANRSKVEADKSAASAQRAETAASSTANKASSGANSDITSLSGLTTPLSVSQGGTGAVDAAGARTNIGLGVDNSVAFKLVTADTTRLINNPALWIGLGSGLYAGWGEDGNTAANFLCNNGQEAVSGGGGFTWRTVNGSNTASGAGMQFTSTGTLNVPGPVNQNSDRRLKKNDVEILDGLEKILQVRPVEFDRRDDLVTDDYPYHEVGVIAQELNEMLPILVTMNDPAIESDVCRVNYTGLIPYLISAIKQLKVEIDNLKRGG